ncbi:guanylate kinase [Fistulifera solaris]|uniref:guanylate kinase n=1 Tax=Fistulifera solaris TaxID=1519565 RepID=A0A1Z5JBH7_FISSO|nr:guanylate kinase [Fistulifera solaris]|eukprot:GAX11353.1 guanylate kinase [Fistulifera solaris]
MSCYKPVVFCGPSGVGKGTLIAKLMQHFANEPFGFSVSHTTRLPREGEIDGVHYNFTTVEQMKQEIEEGKFIEYAEVHGRYYGTSIAAVDAVQKSGKICVLDIDVQGVQSVKQSSLEPLYLFIAPPSMAALEERLRGRGTETEEQMQIRLGNAAQELAYGQAEGNFDKIFVNNDLETCFAEMVQAFQEWYPHLKPVV